MSTKIILLLPILTTIISAFPTGVHYENYQYEENSKEYEDQSSPIAYNRPCRHILYPTYAGTGMDRLEDPLHDPKFTSTIKNYIRLRRHEPLEPEEQMETAASTGFVHQVPIRYLLTGAEPTQQLFEMRQQQPQFIQQQQLQQQQLQQLQQPQFIQQQQQQIPQFVMADPKYYTYTDGYNKPIFGNVQEIPQYQQIQQQQPATIMYRQPSAGNLLVVDYSNLPNQNSLYSNQDKKITVVPKPTNQIMLKPANIQPENKNPIYINQEWDPVALANKMNKQAEQEQQQILEEQINTEEKQEEPNALTKDDRARLEKLIKHKSDLDALKEKIKNKEVPAMKETLGKMMPKNQNAAKMTQNQPKVILKEVEQVKIPADAGEPAKIVEKIEEVDVQLVDDKVDAIVDEKLEEMVDLDALGTA